MGVVEIIFWEGGGINASNIVEIFTLFFNYVFNKQHILCVGNMPSYRVANSEKYTLPGFLEDVSLEMKHIDVEIHAMKYRFSTTQIFSLIFANSQLFKSITYSP